MICTDCGRVCETKQCDGGIGYYEYGSVRDVHHDYYIGSVCCSAEAVNGDEKIIRQSIHTASRNYGKIQKGQRYQLTVVKTWRKNGPFWFRSERNLVK